MVTYQFQQQGQQHGWLSVYDEVGDLLATAERWYVVDEKALNRLQGHDCRPGQMIPLDDPRWYTHCQWCGKQVDPWKARYLSGQWHRECYPNAKEA